MWRGPTWLLGSPASRPALPSPLATTSTQPELLPNSAPTTLRSGPPSSWPQSAPSSKASVSAKPTSSRHAPRFPLLRSLLTCLCLITLPACSSLGWKQPERAPAVVQAKPVRCNDRLMQVCQGIDLPAKTCADAFLIASDSLGAVLACQQAHRLLIECVERHNEEVTGGRNP